MKKLLTITVIALLMLNWTISVFADSNNSIILKDKISTKWTLLSIELSNDWKKYAYAKNENNNKYKLYENWVAYDKNEFDTIKQIGYSKDSKHLIYIWMNKNILDIKATNQETSESKMVKFPMYYLIVDWKVKWELFDFSRFSFFEKWIVIYWKMYNKYSHITWTDLWNGDISIDNVEEDNICYYEYIEDYISDNNIYGLTSYPLSTTNRFINWNWQSVGSQYLWVATYEDSAYVYILKYKNDEKEWLYLMPMWWWEELFYNEIKIKGIDNANIHELLLDKSWAIAWVITETKNINNTVPIFKVYKTKWAIGRNEWWQVISKWYEDIKEVCTVEGFGFDTNVDDNWNILCGLSDKDNFWWIYLNWTEITQMWYQSKISNNWKYAYVEANKELINEFAGMWSKNTFDFTNFNSSIVVDWKNYIANWIPLKLNFLDNWNLQWLMITKWDENNADFQLIEIDTSILKLDEKQKITSIVENKLKTMPQEYKDKLKLKVQNYLNKFQAREIKSEKLMKNIETLNIILDLLNAK